MLNWRIWVGMVCMVLVFNAGSATNDPEEKIYALLDSAAHYLHVGQAEKSVPFLFEARGLQGQFSPDSPVFIRLHSEFMRLLTQVGAADLALPFGRDWVRLKTMEAGGSLAKDMHGVYGRYGALLLAAAQPDSALHWFRKELQLARKEFPSIGEATSLNNIGIALNAAGKPDSALLVLEEALRLKNQLNSGAETAFSGAIRDNIAESYRLLGKPALALPQYEANVSLFRDIQVPKRLISALLGRIEVGLELKQTEGISSLIEEAGKQLREVEYPGRMEDELRLIQLETKFHELAGNRSAAYQSMQRSQKLADSLFRHSYELHNEVVGSLLKFQIRQSDLENFQQAQLLKAERKENDLNRLIILFSGIAFLLFLVLILVFYRQRIRRQSGEKELVGVRQQLLASELRNQQLEKERLEKELRLKEKDLTEFALDITQKRETTSGVLDELETIKSESSGEIEQKVRRLIQDLRGKMAADERKQIFQEKFEVINHAFYEELQEKFPRLTPSEKELCGMIRMRLTMKEIASLRNVTPKAVKMARYRLRKKLPIGSEEDLNEFILRL